MQVATHNARFSRSPKLEKISKTTKRRLIDSGLIYYEATVTELYFIRDSLLYYLLGTVTVFCELSRAINR